jgi:hypothetical protein
LSGPTVNRSSPRIVGSYSHRNKIEKAALAVSSRLICRADLSKLIIGAVLAGAIGQKTFSADLSVTDHRCKLIAANLVQGNFSSNAPCGNGPVRREFGQGNLTGAD